MTVESSLSKNLFGLTGRVSSAASSTGQPSPASPGSSRGCLPQLWIEICSCRDCTYRVGLGHAPQRGLRKHWAFRLLGLHAALLLVAGQLASLGHLALVHHEVCPEHGELMHGAAGAPALAPLRTGSDAHAVSSGTRAEELAHEHCAHFARLRESFATQQPNAANGLDVHGDVTACRSCDAAPTRGALPTLFVAPKQSPPSA